MASTSGEAALPLVGKKLMQKLGGMANEAAAANVSDFAQRQMAKMGWSAGKGLGKHEQGVTSHIKVKKREELQGVGADKAGVEESKSQWWYNVYDRMASKIQVDASDDETSDAKKKKKKKKAKKDRKRKREADASGAGDFHIPTDEELFAATGGKLFGRRAYGSCAGKLKRDELHVAGKLKLNSEEKAAKKAKKAAKKARKAKKEAKKTDKQDAEKSDVEELESPATTSSDTTEEEESIGEKEQAQQRGRAKKTAKKQKQETV